MGKILFIDKPKGLTSFDVVKILSKKLKIKKIGHSGTLDPQATGLLILGIGDGTKELKKFIDLPKTYLMEVLLGIKTDTGDLEGKKLSEREILSVDINKVNQILKSLEGEIKLKIPLYSAVKIKGTRLYKLARKGINIEPPIRDTKIYYIKLIHHYPYKNYYVLECEMRCGKGTYARAVAEKIGEELGIPATLKNLRRIAIGEYKVEDAQNLFNIHFL